MPRPPKNKPITEPAVPVIAAPSVPVAVAPAAHNFKAPPPVIDVDQFVRVRDSVSRLLFAHPRIPSCSTTTPCMHAPQTYARTPRSLETSLSAPARLTHASPKVWLPSQHLSKTNNAIIARAVSSHPTPLFTSHDPLHNIPKNPGEQCASICSV